MLDNPFTTGALSELSIREKNPAKPEGGSQELGQDVFLELMVTQMQNQDPLDPQSNSEFVAQLAQFSSVEGLDKLNDTMEGFVGNFQSNQALQASAMVGRVVKIDTDTSFLANGGAVAGTIELPQDTDSLTIAVYDRGGQLVAEEMMGPQNAGSIPFVWRGDNGSGERLPPGQYRFEVTANQGGTPQRLDTALSANVDSVTVGANGAISLNVAGVGAISLSQVKEIL